MSKYLKKSFLYRIETKDKKGKRRKHLAEIIAESDEAARRSIIHKTFADGGIALSIIATDDATKYPGESGKRQYECD